MSPDKKATNKAVEDVVRLFDYLSDAEGYTEEELREECRAEGIDLDALTNRISGRIRQMIAERKQPLSQENDIPSDDGILREKIAEFHSTDSYKEIAAVYCRHLGEMGHDVLKKLYRDFVALKRLEERKRGI